MEEKDIVRLFIKNGFQVSKDALPLLITKPEYVLSRLKRIEPRPLFLTREYIEKILKETTVPEVKVIRKYEWERKPITVYDYLDFLLFHLKKVKKIISEHMPQEELISINKITSQNTFSTIGIVKEKKEDNIILEDQTGEVTIFFDALLKEKLKEIFLDDIVGVKCRKVKGKIYARNIIYPDIPSTREVKKTDVDVKIALVCGFSSLNVNEKKKTLDLLKEKDVFLTFFFDEKNKKELEKINSVRIEEFPVLFELEKIKILTLPQRFFKNFAEKVNIPSFIRHLLRKRCLLPTFSLKTCLVGDFVLEYIPDIILSDLDGGKYMNYKGTTIISNSDPKKTFLINLRTREVEEIPID